MFQVRFVHEFIIYGGQLVDISFVTQKGKLLNCGMQDVLQSDSFDFLSAYHNDLKITVANQNTISLENRTQFLRKRPLLKIKLFICSLCPQLFEGVK